MRPGDREPTVVHAGADGSQDLPQLRLRPDGTEETRACR